MKYAVIAPVASDKTADPAWMTTFAQHVEACEFESLVVVERRQVATARGLVTEGAGPSR